MFNLHPSSPVIREEEMVFISETQNPLLGGNKIPVRTVTNFAFLDVTGNPVVLKEAGVQLNTTLTGVFGTIDLHSDDGQRLATGRWDKVTDTYGAHVQVKSVLLRQPKWFRSGGKELIVVVESAKAYYALQSPSATYQEYWERSIFHGRGTFPTLDGSGEKPKWLRHQFWVELHEPSAAEGFDPSTWFNDAEGEIDPDYALGVVTATPPLDPHAQFAGRSLLRQQDPDL